MSTSVREQAPQGLSCSHCGAHIPLVLGATTLRCAYCETQNAVPAGLLHALRAAGSEHQRGVQQAASHAREQAAIEALPQRYSQALLTAGGIAAASVAAMALSSPLVSGQTLLRVAVPPLTLLAGGAAMVVNVRHQKQERLRLLKMALPSATLGGAACPHCGAGLSVDAGHPLVRCRHCQSTSLLPAELLLQSARLWRQRLVSERERALSESARASKLARAICLVIFCAGLLASGLNLWLGR